MTTRVVNIARTPKWDVYIGRRMAHTDLGESIWANPYRIPRDGGRTEVIEKFCAYILNRPDLLARLPELVGKTLGCWCAPTREGVTANDPLVCHGQVLCELVDQLPVCAWCERELDEMGKSEVR